GVGRLKYARQMATHYVGGDASNVSIVHPIRVPGSWHRKDEPILCEIEFEDLKREINLEKAIAALERVCPELPSRPNGKAYAGTGADWTGLIQDIITGKAYHVPLVTLSAKKGGRRHESGCGRQRTTRPNGPLSRPPGRTLA